MRHRNIKHEIENLALNRNKMAFISGPRQVGKTTLAKMLMNQQSGCYYNWDNLDFRRLWTKSPQESTRGVATNSTIIFDEIHKASKWKQNLKGVFDTLEKSLRIIVTGSARLDLYKKGSDSLMGRYLGFRLHPFTLGEIGSDRLPSPAELDDILQKGLKNTCPKDSQKIWDDLEHYGGFPEPLLAGSEKILNVWRRGRIEKIVREDLRDLTRIPELSKIEMLISLLPEKVGSPLSIISLKEDLEVSYDSVRRWLNYLKELYYHFEIRPWSKNVSRSLKKEGKLYLWDWSEVKNPGAKFENMIASHLLKACHYWTDTGEGEFELYYLKTKDKKEIDFLVVKDGKPWLPIEAKLNDTTPSSSFKSFTKFLNTTAFYQIVNKPNHLKTKTIQGKTVVVASASQFFRHFP
jgi:uncharacterized protein